MSILLFLVFFSLLSLGHRLEGCQDSSCKNDGPVIHIPFRLSHQPKHCGYPGFELHCNNKNDTILELPSSVHLVVEKIDYVSQKIHLYDSDQCIAANLPKLNLSRSNFTTTDDPTVLFNCSASFTDNNDDYLVPCLGSSGYQVHAVASNLSLDFFWSGPCTKIHQYPYSDSTLQWHPIDRPSIKEVTQMLEGDGSHLNLSPNPFMATNTPKLNASPLSEDLDVILEIE